jgi:hypothetical protein
MLDITDFIASRGGDPQKIRDSQIKRNAPVGTTHFLSPVKSLDYVAPVYFDSVGAITDS